MYDDASGIDGTQLSEKSSVSDQFVMKSISLRLHYIWPENRIAVR